MPGAGDVHSKSSRRQTTGYLPIEDYGLIGNMHTCALVSVDGSVDFMCWCVLPPRAKIVLTVTLRPNFDSPSVFCRLLDKDKGGWFSIAPPRTTTFTTKQQYLPSSNVLQTRYIHEEGVADLIDFFPRPRDNYTVVRNSKQVAFRETAKVSEELKKWLVRRVECIRGTVKIGEF